MPVMSVKPTIKPGVSRETRAPVRNSHAAFTLIELLVVVAIIAILVGMFPASFTTGRTKAQRIKCVSNLKNIGLAFRIYATGNSDLFPWQSTNSAGQIQREFSKDPFFYFLTLTNELSTPAILKCPADSREWVHGWTNFTRANISYFVSRDASETNPQSILTGDRNITTNGVTLKTGIHRITSDANVGWDKTQHDGQGNVVLGDGSVQQLSGARLREQFRNSGLTNITLAIP